MEDRHLAVNVTLPVTPAQIGDDDRLTGMGGASLLLFGVFDGHMGSAAADFVVQKIEELLVVALAFHGVTGARTAAVVSAAGCVGQVEHAIARAFRSLSHDFIKAEEELLQRGGIQKGTHAGTTASVVLLYTPADLCHLKGEAHASNNDDAQESGYSHEDLILTSANVGDSRAVLFSPAEVDVAEDRSGVLQLTVDHTPWNAAERARILELGGFIDEGEVPRVCGNLAVTRSIGDRHLQPFILCKPDVQSKAVQTGRGDHLFMASDGFWDIFDNDDLSRLLHLNLNKDSDYNQMAEWFTREALLRGGADNIGVLISPIRAP